MAEKKPAKIVENLKEDLQFLTNGVGEFGTFGFASEIAGTVGSLPDDFQSGFFDFVGVLHELHVPQHHHC